MCGGGDTARVGAERPFVAFFNSVLPPRARAHGLRPLSRTTLSRHGAFPPLLNATTTNTHASSPTHPPTHPLHPAPLPPPLPPPRPAPHMQFDAKTRKASPDPEGLAPLLEGSRREAALVPAGAKPPALSDQDILDWIFFPGGWWQWSVAGWQGEVAAKRGAGLWEGV